jgi:hypothetical protein
MKPYTSILALLTTLLTTGCIPPTSPTIEKVGLNSVVEKVSFYPYQAGLEWKYVPQGEPVNSPPYVRKTFSVTRLGEDVLNRMNSFGRGTDSNWYRKYEPQGVFLYYYSVPGALYRFEPPIREFPAEAEWKAGLSWRGTTKVTLTDTVSQKVKVISELSYLCTVLEQRRVKQGSQQYQVWVLSRQYGGSDGKIFPTSSEVWFTPFIGEVKTVEDLVLVASNYSIPNQPAP